MWRLDHQEKGLSQVIVTEDLWGVWTMLGIFICNLVCDYHAGTVTVKMLVASLCLTLWDPVDCSSPGPSVCGIFQARVLESVAMFPSKSFPTQGSNPNPHLLPLLYWLCEMLSITQGKQWPGGDPVLEQRGNAADGPWLPLLAESSGLFNI